jgi:hypothetical protein
MDNQRPFKVVKSAVISAKKHEDRYVIIDESTGKTVDDAHGNGYTSERAAISSYRYRHGNHKRAIPVIETWFLEHKDFLDTFNDKVACFERDGIDVDKKWIMEHMLKAHGIEVEFDIINMVRAWEAIISTFQVPKIKQGKKNRTRKQHGKEKN